MTTTDAATSPTLGKYRLIAELGRGGMAEVYLAVAAGPAGFNKLLVVKCIRPHLAEEPEFLAMFLDEARLAARLNHPNVVQTLDVGSADDRYYIAMEYLEGQPLNRILHRLGAHLPLAGHLRILCEVLRGLHHAHELADYDGSALEVVHRDMSPHNVFVTYDGQVKVVDFGIAKALNSSAETRTGVLKGKIGYMSPEQARGLRVDRRADVFSVGVMLWEALVGRRMWKGESDVVVLGHLLGSASSATRPSTLNDAVEPALEAVCLKALEYDRDQRYATALELERAIEGALQSLHMGGSVRETGEVVGRGFAEERARIKTIIEAQLTSARAMPTGEYGKMPLPVLLERGTGSEPGQSLVPRPPQSAVPRSLKGEARERSRASAPTLPGDSSAQTSSEGHSGTMAALERSPAPARRNRALFIGIGAALLVGGAGVVLAMRGSGGTTGADGAVGRAASGASAATNEPSAGTTSAARPNATPVATSDTVSASPPASDTATTPTASVSASGSGSAASSVRPSIAQRPDGSASGNTATTRSTRPGQPGDPDMGF